MPHSYGTVCISVFISLKARVSWWDINMGATKVLCVEKSVQRIGSIEGSEGHDKVRKKY